VADHDQLTERRLPAVSGDEPTDADRIRERLVRNKERLREAVDAMEAAARELTPSARIRHDPFRWVGGAFVVGFLLGWLTGRSR
jgi:ElaB/YqjD/DUF883 family membrane-anchored ribosome-binding protein